tara:strand:+ start:4416 stop:4673 length:258 start_codon:yes stop_codon:yes gene_type:complete
MLIGEDMLVCNMGEAPHNLHDGKFDCDCGKKDVSAYGPFVMICFGPGADELRCGDPVAMRAGTEQNEDCVGDEWFNDEASCEVEE